MSVCPSKQCAQALSQQDAPHWEGDDKVRQGQRLSSIMFSLRLLKRKINKNQFPCFAFYFCIFWIWQIWAKKRRQILNCELEFLLLWKSLEMAIQCFWETQKYLKWLVSLQKPSKQQLLQATVKLNLNCNQLLRPRGTKSFTVSPRSVFHFQQNIYQGAIINKPQSTNTLQFFSHLNRCKQLLKIPTCINWLFLIQTMFGNFLILS